MKRVLTTVLAVGLAMTVLPAHAVTTETVHAEYYRNKIYVEDIHQQSTLRDDLGKLRVPLFRNGTVYIPLRAAGDWLGAETAWDREAGTIRIRTGVREPEYLGDFYGLESYDRGETYAKHVTEGLEVQLLTDAVILIDGQARQFANALGEPVYPLLYGECVYLPLRNIGELGGKTVLWFPYIAPVDRGAGTYFQSIYLYDPPTQSQLEEVRQYLDACRGHIREFSAITDAWKARETLTQEEFFQVLRELEVPIRAMAALQPPSFSPMQRRLSPVELRLSSILNRILVPYQHPEWISVVSSFWDLPPTRQRDHVLRFLTDPGEQSTNDFSSLTDQIDYCQALLTAVEANMAQ